MNTVPRIKTGRWFVDEDGDEVQAHRINKTKDTVTLKTVEGDYYSMGLRELRGKLRDGDFACLESGAEEEDDEEEEADDDEDDEEDDEEDDDE